MAASYIASIEEELTCPLCLELFVDPDHTPKDLFCPHVYCYLCLVKMVEGGRPTITCPECRVETGVPPKTPKSEGGIPALKTNLRIKSLAEKHLKHVEKHPGHDSAQPTEMGGVPICPEHDGEKMHFYCVTCKVVACQACVLLDHERPKHKIKGVKVVHQEKLKVLDQSVEKSEEKARQCELRAEQSAALEEEIHSALRAEESRIQVAVTSAIDSLKKQGWTLTAELKMLHKPQLTKCQQQTKDLTEKVSATRATVTEARKVMAKSTSYEYLQQHDLLVKKLEDMSTLLEEQQENLVVESFTMVQEPNLKLGQIRRVRKLKLNKTLETIHGDIWNIAVGPNGILAICFYDAVHVYSNQQTGQYERKLSLELNKCELQSNDVAVAANGKYLVARQEFVEVYNTSGKYEKKFHTTEDKETHSEMNLTSVNTTPNGSIIVGDTGRSVITLHTADGNNLVKTINLGFQPRRTAAVNNQLVAVCDNCNKKVCVIDLESGNETLNIDISGACSVCYDKETDCLLVSRRVENKRNKYVIKQFTLNTGCFLARISDELAYASDMALTDDGMLAVCAILGSHVKLYQLT